MATRRAPSYPQRPAVPPELVTRPQTPAKIGYWVGPGEMADAANGVIEAFYRQHAARRRWAEAHGLDVMAVFYVVADTAAVDRELFG